MRNRQPLLLLVAVVTIGAIGLGNSASAQEDRGPRPNGEWRRDGRSDRPDADRRRNRDDRGSRDQRREERPAATTPAASRPAANSFGTVSDSDRMRKWASDTVAKHDQNGDKILEGDELANLGQSSRNADSNGDGKITVDELYQFSASKAKPAPAAAASARAATAQSTKPAEVEPAERKITNDKRKSYRFKSTKERTNNWRFSSRDANGDGQVSMSEFARTWNDRTAAEFVRYDKNNDGMITADEVK